jgi:methionyl-tRNA synthetase
VLLSPVLPEAAAKLAAQLNLPHLTEINLADLRWGLVPEGHLIGKPNPVFPKILVEEA